MKQKRSKIKLFAVLALAVVLVLSMTVSAFATPDDGITPYQVSSVTIGFERTSNTSAISMISANTYTPAVYIKVTATLQEWVSSGVFRDVQGTSQSKTVYDRASIYFDPDWTLENSKSYRLKVVVEDKTGTAIYKSTNFSNIE